MPTLAESPVESNGSAQSCCYCGRCCEAVNSALSIVLAMVIAMFAAVANAKAWFICLISALIELVSKLPVVSGAEAPPLLMVVPSPVDTLEPELLDPFAVEPPSPVESRHDPPGGESALDPPLLEHPFDPPVFESPPDPPLLEHPFDPPVFDSPPDPPLLERSFDPPLLELPLEPRSCFMTASNWSSKPFS
jgi:hypothetical protein